MGEIVVQWCRFRGQEGNFRLPIWMSVSFDFWALNKNLEECAYYAAFWKQGFSSSAAPNDDICTKMGGIAGSLWK
jgi:hypothetical protein